MIVDTSTPHLRAASAWLISDDVTCKEMRLWPRCRPAPGVLGQSATGSSRRPGAFGQLTEAVKAQAIEHITLVNAVCHWCGQPLKEPDLGCTRVQAR